jgi:hypothetical protein
MKQSDWLLLKAQIWLYGIPPASDAITLFYPARLGWSAP